MVYHVRVTKKDWLHAFLRKSAVQRLLLCVVSSLGVVCIIDDLPDKTVFAGAVAIIYLFIAAKWIRQARKSARLEILTARATAHDYFLTLTDAGIMMECPVEDKASFCPWKNMAGVAIRQGVLMAVKRQNGRNCLLHLLNVGDMSPETQREITAYCKEHCGKDSRTVPPPALGGAEMTFTGTPQQSAEWADYSLRGSHLLFGVFLAIAAFHIVFGTYYGWVPARFTKWHFSFFVIIASYLLMQIFAPGLFWRRTYSGKSSLEMTPDTFCYARQDGYWARGSQRKTDEAGSAPYCKVVRLPHSLGFESTCPGCRSLFGMADPGQELPPHLRCLTPVPAPGKLPRVLITLAVILASFCIGWVLC